jgi:plasmid stabilization system protein ParE
VPRTLEFLDEAIEEAEAAARWYAERSQTAAAAFADEIDNAIAEITRLPLAWPAYFHNTRRFLLRRFPYSVVYRVSENSGPPPARCTRIAALLAVNARGVLDAARAWAALKGTDRRGRP